MFPTLLASGSEGMQQLEIQVDPENGSILRSDTPLKVSEFRFRTLIACNQVGDVISQI